MNKQDKMQIGRRLRGARERAHIHVNEAARAAGVQPLAVEKWERGTAMPTLLELRALLELYGVMACEILFDSNPIELSADQATELSRAAKDFSPGLRARVDLLLAMLSAGKEPVWRVN